jgi:uncharacterized protein YgiM (DUF1202 family)
MQFRLIPQVGILISFVFYWCTPASAVCVTKDGALLKSSPSATASTSWQVPKYMPLKDTGKSSGQYLEVLDLESERHWVRKSEITRKLNCLVVKSPITTLRTGPGDSYSRAPAGYADKYSAFQDHGGEDGWTQVQADDGRKAWINLDTTWKPSRTIRMRFEEP